MSPGVEHHQNRPRGHNAKAQGRRPENASCPPEPKLYCAVKYKNKKKAQRKSPTFASPVACLSLYVCTSVPLCFVCGEQTPLLTFFCILTAQKANSPGRVEPAAVLMNPK